METNSPFGKFGGPPPVGGKLLNQPEILDAGANVVVKCPCGKIFLLQGPPGQTVPCACRRTWTLAIFQMTPDGAAVNLIPGWLPGVPDEDKK